MYAAPHDRQRNILQLADNQLARVAERGAHGEKRDVAIGDTVGIPQFVSETAQPGAQKQRDARTKRGAREDELRGGFSAGKVGGRLHTLIVSSCLTRALVHSPSQYSATSLSLPDTFPLPARPCIPCRQR